MSEAMKEKAKEILASQMAPSPKKEESKAAAPVEEPKKGKYTAEELEERKKQLEITRNLIMKKRMEERKKELVDYEQQQPKKDDFYLKLVEIERQRKEGKGGEGALDEEEKGVSPEKRAEAEERLRRLAEAAPITLPDDKGEITVTMSIGVALGALEPEKITAIEQVVDMADRALLTAKNLGRNMVNLGQLAA